MTRFTLPNSRAWELIKTCPYSNMGTSEKFAIVALAQAQLEQMNEDETVESVPVSARAVANVWRCSPQNAEEFLNRPRVRPAIVVINGEGRDGKSRRYYALRDAWDDDK